MSKLPYPKWLKVTAQDSGKMEALNRMLKELNINTVCEEANCPNALECFNNQTATFLILGKNCTRSCKFCNVTKGVPENINAQEPESIAKAVKKMNLKYVVITSVTRDDLEDGGASHFANVIQHIRKECPDVKIEVLIPDFKGDFMSLTKVMDAKPEVINHNIETISRLYQHVRPEANYENSLNLIQSVKSSTEGILTKSGMMLGLGETEEEVHKLLRDLKNHKCDIVTIGQYMPPSEQHYPIQEYVRPEQFEAYQKYGESIGIPTVIAGPFVRSSYKASEALFNII